MMHRLHHRFNERWKIGPKTPKGGRFASQSVIFFAIVVILLIQLIIYLLLSSRTIYCKIPNLRLYQQYNIPDNYERLPTIYVITPTYSRLVQEAELTRLSHTLMLVPNLHWIIVEDSNTTTDLVTKFVNRLRDEYNFHTIARLHAPTPELFKLKPGEPSWKHPKGVWQRNRALEWLRENASNLDRHGVVYFADDDNTYDLELFHEMRYTRRVSVWPVGLVGGLLVERPIVSGSVVKGFNSKWFPDRPFPIDMAGFAVSMQILFDRPGATFSDRQRIGFLESHFLSQLVGSWDELEPKADGCTKVLVWHTKTQHPNLYQEQRQKLEITRQVYSIP